MPLHMDEEISPPALSKKPKPRTRKITHPSPERSLSPEEIDHRLTAIYQNEDGHMPNMKKITIKKTNPVIRAFFTFLSLAIFLCALAWVGYFYLPTDKNSSTAMVTLEIQGPKETVAGIPVDYAIIYQNTSRRTLSQAVMTINYPSGFSYLNSSVPTSNSGHTEIKLGTIAPHKSGKITIRGIPYGNIGEAQSWRVLLNFSPDNVASPLQEIATFASSPTTSPLLLIVQAPAKTTAGVDTEFVISVKNSEKITAGQLKITPQWAAGFTLTSSTPPLNKNNQWITSLASTTEKNLFKIRGKFDESVASPALFSVSAAVTPASSSELFTITNRQISLDLIKNSATLSLAANGALDSLDSTPGETLSFTLSLKNTSKQTMNNLSIRLGLDAPSVKRQSVLNWKELTDTHDGDIKGEQLTDTLRHGQIVWTKKQFAALGKLKPGSNVSLDLQLPVQDGKNFDLQNLPDYKITALADVTFTDDSGAAVVLNSNPLTITLNANPHLEIRHDITEGVQNQENHALTWVLTNNFHALKNIEISADLYGDVAFKNDTAAPAGTITYDEKKKHLSWKIAEMPDSVDVLAWPFVVSVLKKNPTQKTLVSKVTIHAEDTVTGKQFDFVAQEIPLQP